MASTSYAATEEMTNINRVSRLLMDPCTDQLRDLLRFYIPPAHFNTAIQTVKLRLPRLTEPQRKLILPSSGVYSGNYDDMDISLLYILLRNVCGIQAQNKGWGNNPDSADRSVSANIERLRLARNRCGHSTGGMSNAEFNQVWSEIRAAVVDLDKTLGIGNKYQKAVDFIRKDTMDPTRDRHFRDQLLKQITETENIKKDVHNLQSGYHILYISGCIRCLRIIRLNCLISCISGKTDENDEQVIEVRQRMIKLESMPIIIFWFLKIFFFLNVLLWIFVFPGIGSQQKINERNIPLNIQGKLKLLCHFIGTLIFASDNILCHHMYILFYIIHVQPLVAHWY